MTRPAEYPLCWPNGWPRAKHRHASQFRTTLAGAQKNVQTELRLFAKDSGSQIQNLVISSNVTLTTSRPTDPGVALWFHWKGLGTVIAVDRYAKVEDNLQAIYKCLVAKRDLLRHGGVTLVQRAFQGYAALPPPAANTTQDWRAVFGFGPDDRPSPSDIKSRYRRLPATAHPDHGGSTAAMAALNAARDAAMAAAR